MDRGCTDVLEFAAEGEGVRAGPDFMAEGVGGVDELAELGLGFWGELLRCQVYRAGGEQEGGSADGVGGADGYAGGVGAGEQGVKLGEALEGFGWGVADFVI